MNMEIKEGLSETDRLRGMAMPRTMLPASLCRAEMMPEIWGLMSTSSRGSTCPVATTNWEMVSRTGVTIP